MTTGDDGTSEKADQLAVRAATVFQPRRPITTRDLFAGRWNELTEISDAVHQPGLHVVIYGERGVGKTSLANVVSPTIWVLDGHDPEDDPAAADAIPERLVLKAVTASGDSFSTLWHRILADVQWPNTSNPEMLVPTKIAFTLGATVSVDDVRRVVTAMTGAVFIFDEFDQAQRTVSKAFTELVKALSDLGVDCTIILVGVSETVENLVEDHASIHRAIAQIRLERMKADELRQIIGKAERTLDIKFDEDAAKLIVHVSQGLPHYTHLIGLHAVRSAAHRWSLKRVVVDDVFDGLKKAVKQAEQTVTGTHSSAVHSSQKTALYRQVLFACALAAARSNDSLGYFSPSAVVDPLTDILQKPISIANFTNHLREFCEAKRGSVLERDGQPWGYRYRFRDPLLVPYVFMDGMEAGITSGQGLMQLLSREDGLNFSS
jgi:hypothetical protein